MVVGLTLELSSETDLALLAFKVLLRADNGLSSGFGFRDETLSSICTSVLGFVTRLNPPTLESNLV